MSFLIFDIETITDTTLWKPPAVEAPLPDAAAPGASADATTPPDAAAAAAEVPKKRSRAKKADAAPKPTKEPFPPLYACRPIAIGFLQLSESYALENIGVASTIHYGDNEPALLAGWAALVSHAHPTLVSFAGRSFDGPVLALRSMHHGVSLPWHDRFKHRYKEDHLDLQDQLTEFGAVARTGYTLSTLSTVLGLPPKTGTDGSQVGAMFAAGAIQKISDYCLEDVFRTAFLFLRYQLMRGHIGLPEYQVAARMLLDNALARGPALGGLTWAADPKRLLMEA